MHRGKLTERFTLLESCFPVMDEKSFLRKLTAERCELARRKGVPSARSGSLPIRCLNAPLPALEWRIAADSAGSPEKGTSGV